MGLPETQVFANPVRRPIFYRKNRRADLRTQED